MADFQLGFSMDDGLYANIRVVGVGGGGCNAVDRMITDGVQGIEFIAINTDHQSLAKSLASERIQIGNKVTRGLGAGAHPETGQKAAEENIEEISKVLEGSDMLFITAGMGGGTGTGSSPVVAAIARKMGILTVGVVTMPFRFEGAKRRQNAERGVRELQQYVDSLIIVPNDKLLEIASDDTSIDDAFTMADRILQYGVSSISDLVAVNGLINLDLADVRRVMTDAGVCHMGIGRGSGESRAATAVKQAMNSPLLDTTIDGAHSIIINFTGGHDMKIKEINEAASQVREAVSPDADIIFGAVIDENMQDDLIITIIASRFDQEGMQKQTIRAQQTAAAAQPVFGGPRRTGPEVARSTLPEDLPEFLRPSTRRQEPKRPMPERKPLPMPVASKVDERDSRDFAPTGQRQSNDIAMADLISRVSESTKWSQREEPEILDEAPVPSSPARGTGRKPQSKGGRVLPWFLQDNDGDDLD